MMSSQPSSDTNEHALADISDPGTAVVVDTVKPSSKQRKAAAKAKASGKFKKCPQAPKRFKPAFIFFSTEKHKEIRAQMGEKGSVEKTTNVAKLVSEAWRNLPDEERAVWEEMARKDKARYELEKAAYKGPWKVPAHKRTPKDPDAPKRPMSAFLAFSNSRRAMIKKQNPQATNADISKALSRMWKEAPPDLKQKYIDEEAKLRDNYKVVIAEWKKNSEAQKKAERKLREEMALRNAQSASVAEQAPAAPKQPASSASSSRPSKQKKAKNTTSSVGRPSAANSTNPTSAARAVDTEDGPTTGALGSLQSATAGGLGGGGGGQVFQPGLLPGLYQTNPGFGLSAAAAGGAGFGSAFNPLLFQSPLFLEQQYALAGLGANPFAGSRTNMNAAALLEQREQQAALGGLYDQYAAAGLLGSSTGAAGLMGTTQGMGTGMAEMGGGASRFMSATTGASYYPGNLGLFYAQQTGSRLQDLDSAGGASDEAEC